MFTIIYEHKILTGLISFFLLSSMICQIISGIIYILMYILIMTFNNLGLSPNLK